MDLWPLLFIHITLYVSTAYSDYPSCVGEEESLLRSEGRPFVWIDHSSTCNPPSGLTCSTFGLDFICTNSNGGDGSSSGCSIVALCAAPKSSTPIESTLANNFKVVAYNVYALDYVYDVSMLDLGPITIPPLYQYSGQRERTCRIPLELIRRQAEADVMVFEELFVGGCFSDHLNFRDLLKYYGFDFITPTVGVKEDQDNLLIVENGGVIIASRWPIVYYEDYIFTNSDPTTADAYASKGVMYAYVMKSDDKQTIPYHIFGTHLQAEVGDKRQAVRELQATEIFNFIDGFGIPASEAVIMAGDFNADLNNFQEHAEQVLANMGATPPRIVGPLQTTWDPLTNELILSENQPNEQWLDYVVLSSSHLIEDVKANLVAFKPQSSTFEICINATTGNYVSSISSDCNERLSIMNLSDHFAVVGSFIFPEKPKKNLKKKKVCKNRRFQR